MAIAAESISQINLHAKASSLLNYCLAHREDELSYDTPVVVGFVNAVYQEAGLIEKWSAEVALEGLFYLLEEYIEESKATQPPVSRETASTFIDQFARLMQHNVADHWLVLPLQKAKLDQVLNFGDFLFIPEMLERKEKISILAELSSLPWEEMNHRAEHTEKTRSPSFYEYTLFCHKIRHHTSWARQMGRSIALLDAAILRTMAHSLELNTRRSIEFMKLDPRERNKHVVILSHDSNRWGHMPSRANENSTVFPGDLSWLHDPELQSKFITLVSLLGYSQPIDRLTFRFRRAVNFFSKAIDIRLSSYQSSEGFALELLHLMIAAESLLLERESEKRLKLATLLSRLIQINGKSTQDIFSAIETIYHWRSDYVHSGDDVFPEYDDDFQEGENQQKVYIVRHAISRLIIDAPKWIQQSESRIKQPTGSQLPNRARERAWFRYLDEIWLSILAGSA